MSLHDIAKKQNLQDLSLDKPELKRQINGFIPLDDDSVVDDDIFSRKLIIIVGDRGLGSLKNNLAALCPIEYSDAQFLNRSVSYLLDHSIRCVFVCISNAHACDWVRKAINSNYRNQICLISCYYKNKHQKFLSDLDSDACIRRANLLSIDCISEHDLLDTLRSFKTTLHKSANLLNQFVSCGSLINKKKAT
jgi:hypothetical protein